MSEHVTARQNALVVSVSPAEARTRRELPVGLPSGDASHLAVDVRTLVQEDRLDLARERFSLLVAAHQRRALRVAYRYLGDAGEADEAVQDAFLKAFSRIATYREAWPFEAWLTRILINGCLDRRQAMARRQRWSAPFESTEEAGMLPAFGGSVPENPEARLLSRERRARLAAAIDRLEGRQRTVFMLCHCGDWSTRDVSAMTGLNESTVRVHLFRAVRKLRALLGARS
ncbi:MAG: RNA polymerase sigma factor [Acidimicrobiia bacterium]|nr:RNA polymerase sigma factor [Acidimicrobiia bacterium]